MTMLIVIFELLMLIAALLVFAFNATNQIVAPISLLIAGPLMWHLYLIFRDNLDELKLFVKIVSLEIKKEKLRISFAHLVQIKIDNQYLLVKSKRTDLWQPVGGVIKSYSNVVRARFDLQDDCGFKDSPEDDLRLTFQKVQLLKVLGFLRWFKMRKDRELSPHREFYEELIKEGVLSSALFSQPTFKFSHTEKRPIEYSEKFKCHELKRFEIYSLILNPQQKDELRKLIDSPSEKYKFLDYEEIERNGFSHRQKELQIGDHTRFVLC